MPKETEIKIRRHLAELLATEPLASATSHPKQNWLLSRLHIYALSSNASDLTSAWFAFTLKAEGTTHQIVGEALANITSNEIQFTIREIQRS